MIAMYSKEYIAIAFNIDIFLKNRKLITMRCWTQIRTEISSAIADSISVLIYRPTTLHCCPIFVGINISEKDNNNIINDCEVIRLCNV